VKRPSGLCPEGRFAAVANGWRPAATSEGYPTRPRDFAYDRRSRNSRASDARCTEARPAWHAPSSTRARASPRRPRRLPHRGSQWQLPRGRAAVPRGSRAR